MDIFFELHRGLPREGPGNNQSTKRALKMVHGLSSGSKILDVGCGPGRQTIELAKNTGCAITALDNHQPFLEQLKRKAAEEEVAEYITAVNGSMFDMKFGPETFDLIWSEGAIYIIGFEKGLREWKKFIKPGGYLVVSELTWLTPEKPEKLEKFMNDCYPAMKSVIQNLNIADSCGYSIAGVFILPKSGWDEYYLPLEKRAFYLMEKYKENADFRKMLENELEEIDIFRKYSEHYGYVFYILRADRRP